VICILIFFQESRKEVDQLIAKERYTTVGSLEEGIEKMAKEKYVFLWTKETMDVLLAGNCTFATLKGNKKFDWFTFQIFICLVLCGTYKLFIFSFQM